MTPQGLFAAGLLRLLLPPALPSLDWPCVPQPPLPDGRPGSGPSRVLTVWWAHGVEEGATGKNIQVTTALKTVSAEFQNWKPPGSTPGSCERPGSAGSMGGPGQQGRRPGRPCFCHQFAVCPHCFSLSGSQDPHPQKPSQISSAPSPLPASCVVPHHPHRQKKQVLSKLAIPQRAQKV